MAMLRMLQIEAEIADVPALIQAAVGGMRIRPESAEIMNRPALPAPERRKHGKNRKTGTSQAPAPSPIPTIGRTDAIRQALEEKPRTNAELLDYLVSRGYKVDSKGVLDGLIYLRNRNEVYKDDRTLAWKLAQK